MLDPEDRSKAFENLTADDFFSTGNRIIFEKCRNLEGNGGSIQAADIYSALTDDDKKFVKADYLFSLIDTIPLAVNIETYIKRLKDAARHRRAIELANAIAKNAYKSDSEAIERLAQQLVIETKEPAEDISEHQTSDLSFPYEVIQGAAGYYADVLKDYTEAPPEFAFMAYLGCLGSVISPMVRMKTYLDTQARLYMILMGNSAPREKIHHYQQNSQTFQN